MELQQLLSLPLKVQKLSVIPAQRRSGSLECEERCVKTPSLRAVGGEEHRGSEGGDRKRALKTDTQET